MTAQLNLNLLELVEAMPGLVEDAFWQDAGPATDGPVDDIRAPALSACEDGIEESDVRLKADITAVGNTVYGLPLYHFRYKKGWERFEGVMAQDVLQVMPDAVVTGDDGFYRVNYAKLGIAMTRI